MDKSFEACVDGPNTPWYSGCWNLETFFSIQPVHGAHLMYSDKSNPTVAAELREMIHAIEQTEISDGGVTGEPWTTFDRMVADFLVNEELFQIAEGASMPEPYELRCMWRGIRSVLLNKHAICSELRKEHE